MSEQDTTTTDNGWPELRVSDWQDTQATIHMWLQVIGKIRMAHAPREQVSLTETIEAARALVLLTVRRCGAHR